ncbi:MAG TPA: hypothetical protein DC051_11525 [Stenotrophomonas maltophilia]|nr:hypothetical protein [Stenotrophomonas maltophilia]
MRCTFQRRGRYGAGQPASCPACTVVFRSARGGSGQYRQSACRR